jgi:hypothetical protein
MNNEALVATVEKRAAPMLHEASKVHHLLAGFRVQNVAEYQYADDALKDIKGKIKELETDRRSFTDPLNSVIAQLNARYKDVIDHYRAAETLLKNAMIAYQAAERERERKALEEAARAAKAGHTAQAAALVEAARAEVPKIAGMRNITTYEIEITDETLVPRQYLMVNRPALMAVVRANKGKIEIPGVKIVTDKSIASTARKV